MNWARQERVATLKTSASAPYDRPRLRALIDEATTDSVDESDEHTGLLGMIREEVSCPFPARLEGHEVECLRFEWPRNGYGLNAACRSPGVRRPAPSRLGDLESTNPYPKGRSVDRGLPEPRAMLV